MDIPIKIIGFEFFREFLFSIDPICCKAPIYDNKLRLDSKKSVILFNIRNKIYNIISNNKFIYNLAKIIYHKNHKNNTYINNEQKDIINTILEVYNSSEIIPMYFNKENVHNIPQKEYNSNYLYHLLTLFLYFKEIELRYKSKVKLSNNHV